MPNAGYAIWLWNRARYVPVIRHGRSCSYSQSVLSESVFILLLLDLCRQVWTIGSSRTLGPSCTATTASSRSGEATTTAAYPLRAPSRSSPRVTSGLGREAACSRQSVSGNGWTAPPCRGNGWTAPPSRNNTRLSDYRFQMYGFSSDRASVRPLGSAGRPGGTRM